MCLAAGQAREAQQLTARLGATKTSLRVQRAVPPLLTAAMRMVLLARTVAQAPQCRQQLVGTQDSGHHGARSQGSPSTTG